MDPRPYRDEEEGNSRTSARTYYHYFAGGRACCRVCIQFVLNTIGEPVGDGPPRASQKSGRVLIVYNIAVIFLVLLFAAFIFYVAK
jgi:hypothetical protein